VRGDVVVYLNRLSDALFVVARWINASAGSSEKIWKP
jgi:cob(I)alamin adenosyltransferase